MKPLFIFAHGAGASSSSAWMQRYAEGLRTLGTVHCFDYPYMAAGRRAPDRLPKLIAAHRDALNAGRATLRGKARTTRPVVLIGKSMGGRVGCHLALEEAVDGVVCLGYPLKGIGKTGKLRDEVLVASRAPMLFIQGTRDNLCPLPLLAEVRRNMTAPNRLYVVEGGNHSLEVTKTQLKASNLTQETVELQILQQIEDFCRSLKTTTEGS